MLRRRPRAAIADMADIPQEDPAVYDMLCKADSVGVFQVESRAQMSMLPRLKPRKFYDLVIEVAIVRPGPIQGDMVHPYLRRREGPEPVDFPAPVAGARAGQTSWRRCWARPWACRCSRSRRCASPSRRRSSPATRPTACAGPWPPSATRQRRRLRGEVRRGHGRGAATTRDFAQRCFKQIEGFGSYGFPESHAVSFALLVYVSAWMKWHHPDVFCAALLNSQPMGFYQPAQLVRDAREHGVEVRAPDVAGQRLGLHAGGRRTIRATPRSRPLRLGLRQIKGFKED